MAGEHETKGTGKKHKGGGGLRRNLALAATKGDRIIAELASEYGVQEANPL